VANGRFPKHKSLLGRKQTAAARCGTWAGMDTPDDLRALGRAFLDLLVARHGHAGEAAMLMLLAAEMKTAGQREPPGRQGNPSPCE